MHCRPASTPLTYMTAHEANTGGGRTHAFDFHEDTEGSDNPMSIPNPLFGDRHESHGLEEVQVRICV